MDPTLILTAGLCLVLGAGISAVITSLVCRTKAAQNESVLRSERDVAQQAVRDRDAAVARFDGDLSTCRAELAAAAEAVSSLRSQRDVVIQSLRDSNETLGGLYADLSSCRAELATAVESISGLRSEKSTLEEKVLGVSQQMEQALRAKEDLVRTQLSDKTTACDEAIAAERDAGRRLIAEKEESMRQQKQLLDQAEKTLREAFAGISQETVAAASEQLLQLAGERFGKIGQESAAELDKKKQAIEGLVKPLQESLEKLDKCQREIEEKRTSAYDGVTGQIDRLMSETVQLSNALRRPTIRGNWGESTLRAVADHAGLIEGQDYELQVHVDGDNGRLRPDMVVRLPKNRAIVIDSKVPMDWYRQSVNAATEEERKAHLDRHCAAVRDHIRSLAGKEYWRQVEGADFVVMFLPTEGMYHAAMEHDPDMINYAISQRVSPANPVTLISLLKSVAYVLDTERMSESAEEVKTIGRRLYDGVRVMAEHIDKLGDRLGGAVEAYGKAIGSMESTILPPARQLKERAERSAKPLPELAPLAVTPRAIVAAELRAPKEPPLVFELASSDEADVDMTPAAPAGT